MSAEAPPRGSLRCMCPFQRWAAPSAATRALAARSVAQTGMRLSRCEWAAACSAFYNVVELLLLLCLGRPLQLSNHAADAAMLRFWPGEKIRLLWAPDAGGLC